MTALPFLNSWTGQTTEELLSLEGQYRTDSLVLAFEQALQMKSALTKEEKVVLAIEALEREVNNGGFHQFFLNSSNEFASTVVSSLTEIGCPRTATLTQAAVNALGVEAPLAAAAIEEAAVRGGEELASKLEPFDSLYFQGAEEPIAEKLFVYIKANRSKVRAGAV
jgi:Domain of unknown function (DUF4375)